MIHGFFATIFYIPFYNALVFLIDVLPGHNAGLAVIILTLIIRLILFPLSKKAIVTQLEMKRLEPAIAELKVKYSDKQEQAQQLLKLYKDNGVNPFASIVLVLIQLPILIGLYRVFRSGLGTINTSFLYAFVGLPAFVGLEFLGITITEKSVILALLAVITQFIQIHLSLPPMKKREKKANSTFADEMAHSMGIQMRFVMPLIIFPVAYVSSVLALYFIAGNIFMILQELFVRRRLVRKYQNLTPKI